MSDAQRHRNALHRAVALTTSYLREEGAEQGPLETIRLANEETVDSAADTLTAQAHLMSRLLKHIVNLDRVMRDEGIEVDHGFDGPVTSQAMLQEIARQIIQSEAEDG
ncbi:hypothetical protein FB554_1359 [Barrientosiimonas humi]|uniref:Uncharacterized protein n=1 Tax=Barrientosiimonas humi TaxID=999931 RepID=A0A542XBL5_9MICO|nr:hypothetical protein [Barrientosiimonas humi]TQL33221.1 hypothetical protein FB554_1359 [Barrientosiimonas humi]CAG7573210.1 hypothetical protein BH39T_PBIAJDOK_01837 [Barrientosiimonas humi]